MKTPVQTRREEEKTAVAHSAQQAPCLGLPALRQKSNLTLEQIAHITKISSRFLKAIEAEQFESLPGGIFSTSYLRQYARCIDFDEAVLLARFNEVVKPEFESTTEVVVPKPGAPSLRQLFRWLRIGLPA